MNIALLEQIRLGAGEFVSASVLGDDVESIQRDLDELERFGFVLERHPYQGVAYRGPAQRLCPDQIEWQLATRLVGRRLAVWNRVSSTNDLAARAAASIANDGLVILAEEQTEGRGRRGRSWSAPPRSCLLLSVLIFPRPPFDNPVWLTALGAVATALTVEEFTRLPARIKWPNDVRVGGRKIGGILVERAQGAVIGIGVNVNLELAELPQPLRRTATSVQRITGGPCDRSEMARTLIRRFDALYDLRPTEGLATLHAQWCSRLEALNRDVTVETAAGEIHGRLAAVDPDKGFILSNDAEARTIPFPEVIALTVCDEPVSGDDDVGDNERNAR